MGLWFLAIVSVCITAVVSATLRPNRRSKNLPPGPPSFPFIGNLVWLLKPLSELELILRELRKRYGPIITMRVGPRPVIFIGSHSFAHRALVQNGAVFSDRPSPPPASNFMNRSQLRISSSPYGATWRLLRRNLTQEILHPSRVKSYSDSRRWVLSLLINRLGVSVQTDTAVRLIDHFQFAMFSLLVFMCFGDRLPESQIKEIESAQRALLLAFRSFNRLMFWPRLGRFLFRKTWRKLFQLREEQDRVLIPLIRDRISRKDVQNLAYVDTLVDLELPEQNRKLKEGEMVTLCSEFLTAGTDTTSTALQWIMANLVKYPHLQEKLYQEIIGVAGESPSAKQSEKTLEEEDLEKMPYLKAVVLEGLRRHPPGHFVLTHKVKEDVELDSYRIPKNTLINFMVADMGWDPEVWEEPMEFKPERFIGEAFDFDITGTREIKMMPFGIGRRICPGLGLAMLHLEYFVANLIWYFKWSPMEVDGVDLTEKQEFTTVMKYPLQARIFPRNHC